MLRKIALLIGVFVLAACSPAAPPTLAPTSVALLATPTPMQLPSATTTAALTPTSLPSATAPAMLTPTSLPSVSPTVTLTPMSLPSVTPSSSPTLVPPTSNPLPTQVLAAACSNKAARITGFYSGAKSINDLSVVPTLAGYITIYTTANAPDFQYAKIEYSGDDRRSWVTTITYRTPLVDIGGFGWSTTQVPDGDYWMRTLVVLKSGNYLDPCEIRVSIKNAAAPTPSTIGCQDARVTITGPLPDQTFANVVPISAKLQKDIFSAYQIQYSRDRTAWTNIGGRVSFYPTEDFLANWEVSNLSNGDYWIRILNIDKSGNYGEPCSVHVVVKPVPATPLPAGACGVPGANIRTVNSIAVTQNMAQPVTLKGSISLSGAADRPNLSYYAVQYSQDRVTWIDIIKRTFPHHDEANVSIAAWQTSSVPNGDYWVHIRVVDTTGNQVDSCDVHVVVSN